MIWMKLRRKAGGKASSGSGTYSHPISEDFGKRVYTANMWRNRGELAEGWYDPSTLQKAIESSPEPSRDPRREEPSKDTKRTTMKENRLEEEEIDPSTDSDSSVGPTLPGKEHVSRTKRSGPSIPNMQDLELKRGMFSTLNPKTLYFLHTNFKSIEMDIEDRLASRERLQLERKAERTAQKSLLDELAPHPDAGTHARRLENRSLATSKLNSFAEAKTPGIVDEVPESELFGDGDDLKRQKQEVEKKKNERELRKEEFLRARREEREERLEEYRRKEEETMGMLRALAKQRFG
jgi:hypothetical protein